MREDCVCLVLAGTGPVSSKRQEAGVGVLMVVVGGDGVGSQPILRCVCMCLTRKPRIIVKQRSDQLYQSSPPLQSFHPFLQSPSSIFFFLPPLLFTSPPSTLLFTTLPAVVLFFSFLFPLSEGLSLFERMRYYARNGWMSFFVCCSVLIVAVIVLSVTCQGALCLSTKDVLFFPPFIWQRKRKKTYKKPPSTNQPINIHPFISFFFFPHTHAHVIMPFLFFVWLHYFFKLLLYFVFHVICDSMICDFVVAAFCSNLLHLFLFCKILSHHSNARSLSNMAVCLFVCLCSWFLTQHAGVFLHWFAWLDGAGWERGLDAGVITLFSLLSSTPLCSSKSSIPASLSFLSFFHFLLLHFFCGWSSSLLNLSSRSPIFFLEHTKSELKPQNVKGGKVRILMRNNV